MSRLHKLYGKIQKLIGGDNDLVMDESQTNSSTPKQESTSARLTNSRAPRLQEGEDYYYEGNLMVMTAAYLTKRGYCCESGCRHCPYGFKRTDKNR